MFACASAAAEQLESEFVLPVSGQSVEGHPERIDDTPGTCQGLGTPWFHNGDGVISKQNQGTSIEAYGPRTFRLIVASEFQDCFQLPSGKLT